MQEEPTPEVTADVPAPEEPEKAPRRPSRKTVIYTGFGGFLLFILAFAVFFYYNFKTIEVQGDSMEPTLTAGDRLLISKAYWLIGPIKEDDIVVVRNPYENNEVIIKRVYRTEGGTVGLKNVPETWDITQGQYVVPKGTIFILGDNAAVSQDSRHYGPFAIEDVIGKMVVIHPAIDPSADPDTK